MSSSVIVLSPQQSSIIVLSPRQKIVDHKEEGCVDRISDLPDDIILNHIITPLNFKDKLQTSILSKKWRELIAQCPELNFDYSTVLPSYTKSGMIKVLNSVAQVLRSLRAPSIVKFHLKFNVVDIKDGPRFVDKLVKFAISRRVKDLRLDSSCIRGYTLGYDVLKHSPIVNGRGGISSLTSLQLVDISISGDVLEYILSHCHLLECLLVNSSYTLESLVVRSPKLKRLTVFKCYRLKELVIEAEKLIYFNYVHGDQHTVANVIIKSAPMLVEADIGGHNCAPPISIFPQIASSVIQLSKLSLDFCEALYGQPGDPCVCGVTLPSFRNVQQLEIRCMYYQYILLCTLWFMHACPRLQKLSLKKSLNKWKKWPPASMMQGEEVLSEWKEHLESEKELEHDDSSESELPPSLEHPNLRVLATHGFMGSFVEIDLIKYILECATNLKTIICDPHTPVEQPPHILEATRSWGAKLAKILPQRINVISV